VSRQKAEIAAERHHRATDEQPRVRPVLDGALQTCGEREQGLARTGLAHDRNQPNAVVEQEVEREALLLVAWADGDDPLARHAQSPDLAGFRVVTAEPAPRLRRIVAQDDA